MNNKPMKIFIATVLVVSATQTNQTLSDPLPEKVFQLRSSISDEYQDAISKAFPGYQILSPSEILLPKKEMGSKLYNKVKVSPSLIVGKFNDDQIGDFAALIRNSTKKTDTVTMDGKVIASHDFYGGSLVVCYGLGEAKYDCSRIPRLFHEPTLPANFALNKTGPGKYSCAILRELNMDNDREPFDSAYGEKRNANLVVHADVINFIKTTNSGEKLQFFFQPGTDLMECVDSSD